MTETTYIEEQPGRLVEYRDASTSAVRWIEARELKKDGTPYGDRWWRISDAELVRLQRYTDIVHRLWDVRCCGVLPELDVNGPYCPVCHPQQAK
jgi:hypothetical protein